MTGQRMGSAGSGGTVVSIVTPSLNQARYLDVALRSVAAQGHPRMEHIVVDGGSTDGTLDILRREGDRGAIRWVSEPDGGMYDAINKGLALSTGEVLAYLNSDDAYLPWALDAVTKVFASRPDVDLVFGDGVKIDEGTGAQRVRLFPPFDRVSLANYESVMQPAVFWRRRVLDLIGGFDATLRFVADLDYWLRAGAAGARIVHLDEVIAIERIHEARLSTARKDAMAAENREMRARHAGLAGGPAGRELAKARYRRWQRWLWFRFLVASATPWLPGPWHRFLQAGRVTVRPGRVIRGAAKYPLQWNAVTSGFAAEVLSGHGG